MRPDVTTVMPDTSVRAAAALMKEMDTGLLVVCQDGRPVGVVTDRDIVIRQMSRVGSARDVPVRAVMSPGVIGCSVHDSIEIAAGIMGDRQVRRLIVRSGDGHLAGVLSLGDIAREASEEIAGQTLGEIVELR